MSHALRHAWLALQADIDQLRRPAYRLLESAIPRLQDSRRDGEASGAGPAPLIPVKKNSGLVKRGRHGVPIWTDPRWKGDGPEDLTADDVLDRKGQLWRRACPWMPAGDPRWRHLVRPGWLEPVGVMEQAYRARGLAVPVYGILGGYGAWETKRGRWRAGWIRRREFPPMPGKRGGVYGWRAQVVACYVLARWRELTGAKLVRGQPHGLGRIKRRMERIQRGETAWTIGDSRRVAAAVRLVKEARKRRVLRRLARRTAQRVRRHQAPMRVTLLSGRVTLG